MPEEKKSKIQEIFGGKKKAKEEPPLRKAGEMVFPNQKHIKEFQDGTFMVSCACYGCHENLIFRDRDFKKALMEKGWSSDFNFYVDRTFTCPKCSRGGKKWECEPEYHGGRIWKALG